MSRDWKRSGWGSGDHYIAPVQRSIAPGKVTRTAKLALQMRAAAARRPVAPEPATRPAAADAAPLQAKAAAEASEPTGQAEATAGLLQGRALAKAQRNNPYYQSTYGFDPSVFLPGCQDPASPELAQAIAQFQQAHGGLVVDGMAGPRTCEVAGASGAADAAGQAADASQIEPDVLDLDPALVGTGAIEPGVLPPPPTGDVLEDGVIDFTGGDVLGGDVLGGDGGGELESGLLEMPPARPPSRTEQAVDRAAIDMPKEESLTTSRATISTRPVQRQAGPSETVATKSAEGAASGEPPAVTESGPAPSAPRTSAADAAIERLEGTSGGSQERFAVRQGAVHVRTVLQGALGKLGRQERAAADHVAAAESAVRAACRFLRVAYGRGLRAPELVKLTAATNEAIKKLETLGWDNPGPTELARPPAAPDAGDALQRRATDSARPGADDPRAIAAEGVQGGGSALPHLDTIQASFGGHDVTGVRAHVGGAAGEAAEAIGAEAFATGNDVAFREAPDLHTAAHEAAHVVQQRAGVQLKGGIGEVGDTYERHADRAADAVVDGHSAAPILDEMASAAGPVASVQMKEEQSAASKLAAPPEIDFGDQEVGSETRREVYVWNIGTLHVGLGATIGNYISFRIESTPGWLPPTRDPNGVTRPIVIVYLPRSPGPHHDQLDVTTGEETLGIPVRALAHAKGDTTAAQKEQCRAEEDAADREAAERARNREQVRQLVEADAQNPERYAQHHENAFDGALASLRRTANTLFLRQTSGVTTARDEAISYERELPPTERSVLRGLAAQVLGIAAAGVAGYVAVRLGEAIPAMLRTLAMSNSPESGPSGAVVGALQDSVKESIKQGGKKSIDKLDVKKANDGSDAPSASDTPATAEVYSTNPTIDLFSALRDALIDSQDDRGQLIEDVVVEVRPLLRSEPDVAVDALRSMAAAIGAAAETDGNAHSEHALAAVSSYVSLVARSSLGRTLHPAIMDVCGREQQAPEIVTNTRSATEAPRHAEPRTPLPAAHDGLLDIVFDGDPVRPWLPVVVVRAEIKGISQEIADRLHALPSLLEARIPVRAYGDPSTTRPTAAVFPVTVTRDEAGGIRVAGDLRYLAGKAGKTVARPTEADALPGGRKLIEEEILGKPLREHGVKSIATDDATGRGNKR